MQYLQIHRPNEENADTFPPIIPAELLQACLFHIQCTPDRPRYPIEQTKALVAKYFQAVFQEIWEECVLTNKIDGKNFTETDVQMVMVLAENRVRILVQRRTTYAQIRALFRTQDQMEEPMGETLPSVPPLRLFPPSCES